MQFPKVDHIYPAAAGAEIGSVRPLDRLVAE